jgi:hypothetical protein
VLGEEPLGGDSARVEELAHERVFALDDLPGRAGHHDRAALGAIDKTKLAGAEDPSAAPVWMPGQDLTADNISPNWKLPTSKIPR